VKATIFTGWIYDHLLPHAEKVKVAHLLMLRAISGRTIASMPARSPTACAAISCPSATWLRPSSETGAGACVIATWCCGKRCRWRTGHARMEFWRGSARQQVTVILRLYI